MGCINDKNFVLGILEAEKSKIKVYSNLSLCGDCLLLPYYCFLGLEAGRESAGEGRTEGGRRLRQERDSLLSCLIVKNDPNSPHQGPTHMTMFNFNYLHTPCAVSLEIRASVCELQRKNSVHNGIA